MVLATPMWHPDHVTEEEAMTELRAALADTSPDADEQRALRIAAAFYEKWRSSSYRRGWQAELVRETGLTRETIRRHIEDERIRRGEIPPTVRYLKQQAALARKKARASS
jgi:hypothetical protein